MPSGGGGGGGGDGDDGVDLSINPVFSRIKHKPGDQRRFVIVAGFIGEVKDGLDRIYPTLIRRSQTILARGIVTQTLGCFGPSTPTRARDSRGSEGLQARSSCCGGNVR
jgi:hypothetical protein